MGHMKPRHSKSDSQFCRRPRFADKFSLSSRARMRSTILLLVVMAFTNLAWGGPPAVKGPTVEHIKGAVRLNYAADAKSWGEVLVYDSEWKDRNIPDTRKLIIKVPPPKFIMLPHSKPAGNMVSRHLDIPTTALKPGKQYWYEFRVQVPQSAGLWTNGTFTTQTRID